MTILDGDAAVVAGSTSASSFSGMTWTRGPSLGDCSGRRQSVVLVGAVEAFATGDAGPQG